MYLVKLSRIETGDHGTFGKLTFGDLSFFTGELPWRGNKSNISCIPADTYRCEWTYSPRFKRFTYEVNDIPDRFGIRKHSANFVGDAAKGFKAQVNGCVTLGEKLGWMDGQKAVLLSKPAIRRFEEALNKEPFFLEITNA